MPGASLIGAPAAQRRVPHSRGAYTKAPILAKSDHDAVGQERIGARTRRSDPEWMAGPESVASWRLLAGNRKECSDSLAQRMVLRETPPSRGFVEDLRDPSEE